jgi:inorganic pyrophosphatase
VIFFVFSDPGAISMNDPKTLLAYFKKNFKPHPWHGIPLRREDSPFVNVFIEIVPTDTVKYELDKDSGYLSIDRPQKFSNVIPSLYGFIPQTYCGDKVASYAGEKTSFKNLAGDGDPLDICVLTERPISHGDLLLQARPIGGLRMIDGGEVDDKIIAVLKDDSIYGHIQDIKECLPSIIRRLKHYFLTYKDLPDEGDERKILITDVYDRTEAEHVISLASQDYKIHWAE